MTIERDDANVVQHLNQNHDVSRCLHNLIGIVVGSREHWWSVAIHMDAAHRQWLILYGIRSGSPLLYRSGTLGCSFLSQGRQRRKLSVRWIDDHRRARSQCQYALATVQPKLSEVIMDVGDGSRCGLLFF